MKKHEPKKPRGGSKLAKAAAAAERPPGDGLPPPAADVAAALFGAVRTFGREPVELEFRLGHAVGTAFVPGVSERCWNALKGALDESAKAGSMTVATVETRERIQEEAGAKYVLPEGYWMFKKRLFNGSVDMPDSPWTCRVSISTERVDRSLPEPTLAATMERHKQRWSYRYECWSVDLTRVVSNLSHQRDNDGVAFEVEIELVDTAEMYVRPLDAIIDWGTTLARDMCRLMKA